MMYCEKAQENCIGKRMMIGPRVGVAALSYMYNVAFSLDRLKGGATHVAVHDRGTQSVFILRSW